MEPILKQKITDKLRAYLNREPTEQEIMNGNTDANVMHWIAKDDAKDALQKIDKLQADIKKPVI